MHGITGDDKLRLMLSLEELLIGYRHHFGEDSGYTLKIGKKKGIVTIELLIRGIRLDLFSEPDSLILIKVLHGWSNAPIKICLAIHKT